MELTDEQYEEAKKELLRRYPDDRAVTALAKAWLRRIEELRESK